MIHVMHDIETLASQSAIPLILSIGAVKFDGENIIDRFHVGIDPVDAQRLGLEIEADTVMWWMDDKRQEARAQMALLGKVDLFAALDGYALWVNQTGKEDLGSAWSQGSNFDNAKLKAVYQKVGVEWPFSYRQEECYRTMRNRYPDVPFNRLGVHHGALDDAESQAVHLQAIAKHAGFQL